MGTPPAIPAAYQLRRIRPGDGKALSRFYRGLSRDSQKKLTPLGLRINRDACEFICFDNFLSGADKYDLILLSGETIVGWCFVWGIHGQRPALGLAIADECHGQGLGRRMLEALLSWLREAQLAAVFLTVGRENAVARHLYESFGFVPLEAPSREPGCVDMALRLAMAGSGDQG